MLGIEPDGQGVDRRIGRHRYELMAVDSGSLVGGTKAQIGLSRKHPAQQQGIDDLSIGDTLLSRLPRQV